MKLVKYDKNKLGTKYYTKTDHQKLIEEFANSDMDCAKIEGWTHANASSCQNALAQSIKRFNFSGIRAMVRNKEVFLVKI